MFDALEAEQDQLAVALASFTEAQWHSASGCPGWRVVDVVLHLAQTEELVMRSVRGDEWPAAGRLAGETADEAAARWVAAEPECEASAVFERWNSARRDAAKLLRSAAPDRAVPWIATALKPRTLATTRLSEHWIHALDILVPLGMGYPETERLWHAAWLAHRTIPYAFQRASAGDPPGVRLELRSPGAAVWEFGPHAADCRITGAAAEFCRVAARRKDAGEAVSLQLEGDRARVVLELVRLYA
ncbi:MAG: maleylpyruvate isomerase family mycothiol-dependent enzyme [Actinomycetota bacterium]|nr:maleylpyruvate isomerase family mycothiol-dependent enzyme [Actinomycetota bacterium]